MDLFHNFIVIIQYYFIDMIDLMR